MKRLLSILLVLVMVISVPAIVTAAPNDYTPGKMTYSLDLNEVLNLEGAEIKEGELKINQGGKASFDIFFDFDVAKVEVKYSTAASGNLNITMEENSYDIPLVAEETFAKADVIDRRGSHVITLSSDCAITITDVTFTKVSRISGKQNDLQVKLDEYDEATLTSVVVNPDRVALKVDGAFRYVDYDDTSVTPIEIDGRIYLPIHTAARAFSVYYEDYADLNYVYLMEDNFEMYASESGSYKIINGKKTPIDNFVVYIDGKAWVPFRQLAEILGYTVSWRDGYAIADDRMHVERIVEDEEIFSRLVEEFNQFDKSLVARNKTYYVSQAPYAKDSNDGSENFPYRTIQAAADVAQAGDTVIIDSGVYREEVVIKNDGTATQPIIFKAKEGADVTISAFEKISGFEPYKNGIYQKFVNSIGYDRNFIIMNDEILREGRHPNKDTSTMHFPHPGYDKENIMRATMGDMKIPQNDKFTAYSDIDLDQDEKDYWKGGTFITLTGEAWTLSYGQIIASEKGKISLADYPGNTSYGLTNYYNQKCDDDYGYITHHLNTVDMPGEWYIDDATNILYIIPPEGVDPNTMELELKQRQRVVDMRDRKFVQFHNINTRGGGITMAGDTEMNVLNGGTHKYIAQVDWSTAHNTHSLRFYDKANQWTNKTDAPELGEAGFFCHGYNNAFVNTHIAYSSNAGIYSTGTYTYIDNNFIEHTGYMGTYPAGVTLEGVKWDAIDAKYGGHTVVGNSIVGAGRANLYMSRNYSEPGSNTCSMLPYLPCDFSFNHIWMGSTVARDTGNIYMYGITAGYDRAFTDMHHNITYDIATQARNSYMAANYYHDGHSTMVSTRSNISFATREGHIISDFYQHTNGDYQNYIEKWGNTTPGIIPEGIKGLEVKDYPFGKPFDVGSTLEVENRGGRFMKNYERLNTEFITLAEQAVLEGGAVMAEDGMVDMPTGDASVTFKDITFGDEGTELTLFYSSDMFKYSKDAMPTMSFDFIKDGKVVESRYEPVAMHLVRMDKLARVLLYLPADLKGTYDVRVKVDKDYVRICKLMVADCNFMEVAAGYQYPLDGDIIQTGTWDACLDCANQGPRTSFKTEEQNVLNKTNMSISNSNQHKLLYKARHITRDATKMTVRISSSWEYSNSYVEVYKDSMRGTPIASFDLHQYIPVGGGHGWTTVYPTIDLTEPLKAGTYDFYLVFKGHPNDDPSITTEFGVADCHWFAFHNGETYQGSTPKPTVETTENAE